MLTKPSLAQRLAALKSPSAPTTSPKMTPTSGFMERARFAAGVPVSDSPELRRILALPRRDVVQVPEGWAEQFKRPGGTMDLRPVQAQALYELSQHGGLLGPIGVGHGKTLLSLLAPTVLHATVTVLLVPPQLKAQLLERDYPALSKHWRLPNLAPGHSGAVYYPDAVGTLHVVAYSELSSAKKADVLERLAPDLIVADEAHSIAAYSSARTKRFRRFLKKHPATRFVALSGTLISRSIKDVAPLSSLALKAGSPYPRDWPTTEEFSWALDDVPMNSPPGALSPLRDNYPGEDIRAAYGRRVRETPGVVSSPSELSCEASLVFTERPLALPVEVEKALDEMRRLWIAPNGDEIPDKLAFSRYARQLASGLYLRWTWPRGEAKALRDEWREARRDWAREVRDYLAHRSAAGRDSEKLLRLAAESGAWASATWARWAAVREKAKPVMADPYWVSKFMAADAYAWTQKHRGIVWVEYPALGAALQEYGVPFYGADSDAELLKVDGSRSIACSIPAHHQGKNLQCFASNLVTYTSSSGKKWEQLIGRTHRQGQTADEIAFAVYRHTAEVRDSFDAAAKNATFLVPFQGPQRLLVARCLWDKKVLC